ncbi:MAG: ABC transporter permease [Clostridiales bacterium]|jgi:ABC-type antimicrobial peptide transport system permease subunit|nr:ABC transporter permease [Clostridiales bacterium]
MKNYDLLVLANKNLWRRKGRTVLTVLGVIIGTASIVVMLSLGIGLVESQKKQMEQWGSLNIIRVHQAWDFPGHEGGQQKRLTDEAIAEIRAIKGVTAISPAIEVGGEARFGRKIGHIMLVGLEPGLMEQLEFSVSDGRLLNQDDRFNVVAGSQVINNFWDPKQRHNPWEWEGPPQGDPLELLDQRLSLTLHNNKQQKRIYNLNVVGILSQKTMERAWEVYAPISELRKMRDFINQGRQDNSFQEKMYMDEKVIISPGRPTPARPAPKLEEQYSFALVRTDDVGDTRRISKELRDRSYNAYSMADNLEGIEEAARRFQAILGGIGAITLLVAAIGITNTMVMSIYERTREIAIMKVIGASFREIRWLFLAESSLIGLLGGSFGIGLSFLLSSVLNRYGASFMNPGGGMMPGSEAIQISMIPPWLVGFALLFSISIGLLSGIYPANRAIRLDPITAMRHG